MENNKDIKLKILLNAFNNEFLATRSNTTKKAYIKYINDFFQTENLEDITLSQVSSVSLSDAQIYHDNLLKKGFQEVSVNHRTIALSYFYDFLLEKNVTNMNPFSKSQVLKNYTLDSLLKLQISMWPDHSINKIQELKKLVINEEEVKIGFWSLLRYFPDWKNKSKKKYVLFLDLLDNLNIGLEPDFRFTGIIPGVSDDVILFSLDNYEEKAAYSPAYAFASLNLKLGAMVSKADGIVVEKEIILLKNQIKRWPGLNALEKKRLELYLDWILSMPMDNKSINKGVRLLNIDEKNVIADWLIKVSLADGIIRPEEIKLMEKLYSIMNLDTKELLQNIDEDNVEPITKKTNKNIEKNNPTAVELLDFLLDYIG